MTDANTSQNTVPSSGPGRDADTVDPTAPTVPVMPRAQAEPDEKPGPAATTAPSLPPSKRRPLFPTILWGAMMLALAAFFAARGLVPGGLDLVTWLLTAVVGIGLVLVVAGIIAASRRAG